MKKEEIRQHLSQQMLGAAIGIGLIAEGLAGKVEPDCLSTAEQAAFAKLSGKQAGLCAKWASFALHLRGKE